MPCPSAWSAACIWLQQLSVMLLPRSWLCPARWQDNSCHFLQLLVLQHIRRDGVKAKCEDYPTGNTRAERIKCRSKQSIHGPAIDRGATVQRFSCHALRNARVVASSLWPPVLAADFVRPATFEWILPASASPFQDVRICRVHHKNRTNGVRIARTHAFNPPAGASGACDPLPGLHTKFVIQPIATTTQQPQTSRGLAHAR